jgi:hypothetical protein
MSQTFYIGHIANAEGNPYNLTKLSSRALAVALADSFLVRNDSGVFGEVISYH